MDKDQKRSDMIVGHYRQNFSECTKGHVTILCGLHNSIEWQDNYEPQLIKGEGVESCINVPTYYLADVTGERNEMLFRRVNIQANKRFEAEFLITKLPRSATVSAYCV
jgi:hypothetical protein